METDATNLMALIEKAAKNACYDVDRPHSTCEVQLVKIRNKCDAISSKVERALLKTDENEKAIDAITKTVESNEVVCKGIEAIKKKLWAVIGSFIVASIIGIWNLVKDNIQFIKD